MAKILVVEDDAEMARSISRWLEIEGHTANVAQDGVNAKHLINAAEFDLIILDRNLPDLEGLDLLRSHRQQGKHTPVLCLTGKRSIEEKLEGFREGADDYLTKPFHIKELMARVGALLKRPKEIEEANLEVGRLKLIPQRHAVVRDGLEIALVGREYALLEFLLQHPNELFPVERLLNQVWSDSLDTSNEAFLGCVKRLRKKIDVTGQESFIRNVYGVGYGVFPEDR